MAVVRVRYINGEQDEWTLAERMDPDELALGLWKVMSGGGGGVSFTAETEVGSEVDYARVGFNIKHVVMWQIDGLLNPDKLAFLGLGDET